MKFNSNIRSSFLLLMVMLLISACAKVYYSPEAESAARKHRIIAVAIPKVNIPAQKNMSADDLKKLAESEAESFHAEMVNWLLKRKDQGKISVDILDAATTLAKINRLKAEKGEFLTPKEISDALGVDAVITSNYKMTKPMSTGAAIATSILFGFGTTNEAIVSMELHDNGSNKSIWNFNHRISGGVLNSAQDCVNEVMRVASKKLPYTKFNTGKKR